MNLVRDLSTRAKLLIGYGILMLGLAAVVWSTITGIREIQGLQKTLFETEYPNAMDVWSVRSNFNGARTSILEMYGETAEGREASRADAVGRLRDMRETMKKLIDAGTGDAPIKSLLVGAMAGIDDFARNAEEKVFPLLDAGRTTEAQLVSLGGNKDVYTRTRAILLDLEEKTNERVKKVFDDATERANQIVDLTRTLGIFVSLLGLAIVLLIHAQIAPPLRAVTAVAERIAAGDLSVVPAANDRADEVGMLERSTAAMVTNLRAMTSDLQGAIAVLGASSNELLAASTQLATGTTETSAAISETTVTVEEVKQTAELVNQKARMVADTAQKTTKVAETGARSVLETTEAMNRIRTQMEQIAQTVVRLSERGQDIGDIVSTVNELADQSSILAVNAGIEAAKAGEQGKGFAVVAQEVRHLAEQSKQATAQVRTILKEIQAATTAAVMATDQGTRAVESGVRLSTEAGGAIRTLAEAITESGQAALQVSVSSQQQLVGMEQVAGAMENIKQASVQNLASTKQAEATARGLHDLGEKLRDLVDRYKL